MNSIKILSAVPVPLSAILESSSAGAGPYFLRSFLRAGNRPRHRSV